MEDARRSGQELHMMVADLSKAFDTMEYWSQELSWRTMGMPQDMIDLMVNLDSGSEEGEGATTEVALGKGRKTPTLSLNRLMHLSANCYLLVQ